MNESAAAASAAVTASAPVARERLQILLAHERGLRGQPDLLGVLREEILAVVSRHVTLDPDKVIVRMERGKTRLDARSRYRSAQRIRKVARGRQLTTADVRPDAPPVNAGAPLALPRRILVALAAKSGNPFDASHLSRRRQSRRHQPRCRRSLGPQHAARLGAGGAGGLGRRSDPDAVSRCRSRASPST